MLPKLSSIFTPLTTRVSARAGASNLAQLGETPIPASISALENGNGMARGVASQKKIVAAAVDDPLFKAGVVPRAGRRGFQLLLSTMGS